MTKVLRTESHRIRSLEGSNCDPSHLAALSLVGSITFLPANHYDDSELQPFVTNSFTRLPCTGIAVRLLFAVRPGILPAPSKSSTSRSRPRRSDRFVIQIDDTKPLKVTAKDLLGAADPRRRRWRVRIDFQGTPSEIGAIRKYVRCDDGMIGGRQGWTKSHVRRRPFVLFRNGMACYPRITS
jgi:hypothetical protein